MRTCKRGPARASRSRWPRSPILASRSARWPASWRPEPERRTAVAPNPNLERLREAGVSIWLDTLSRDLLETGEFERLVRDFSVSGATSNPTIFAKAITGSDRYDDELHRAVGGGVRDPRELFFELALEDIRRAAEVLRPVHETAGGGDGFVSFECTPDLADDTDATIEQALELWG